MASSREFIQFILDQTAGEDVVLRAMMGEYLLYCRGKLIGGVYDNRLLLKPTSAARAALPSATEEIPYPGAKPMLLVEELDDGAALTALFVMLADALPPVEKKPRGGKRKNG